MPVHKIYTSGCTEMFLSWLSWNLDFVGIVGLGTSIPQVNKRNINCTHLKLIKVNVTPVFLYQVIRKKVRLYHESVIL